MIVLLIINDNFRVFTSFTNRYFDTSPTLPMTKRLPLYFVTLFVFISFSIRAQNSERDIYWILDSLNAMQQLPKMQTANVKPFLSLESGAKPTLKRTWTGTNTNNTATSCFDTSRRSFVVNGTMRFYTFTPYPSADGKFLLSGQYQEIAPPYKTGGFLAKLDHKGNVLWHRTYKWDNPTGYSFINYYKVMELNDGSIFLAGVLNNPITGNNDIIFTKTDAIGNIIWSKVYKSRLWGQGSGSADYYYVQQMKEDVSTGYIFLTGPTWSEGRTLMKLNAADGIIAWGKAYKGGGSFDSPIGLEIKPDRIRFFSRSLLNNNVVISMTESNKITGDSISFKYWKSEDTAGIKVDLLGTDPLTILNNGHYVLTGKSFGNFTSQPGTSDLYQASVIEFDNDLNFVKAYNFRNQIESNSSNTSTTTYPDGSSFFTMLRYISSYTSEVYSIQLLNGQILRQRVKHTSVGIPREPQAVKAPDGGDLIMRLIGDTSDGVDKIEVLNLHSSDTSSVCLGVTDYSLWLYNFMVKPFQSYTGSLKSDIFEETTNRTIITSNIVDQYLPGCVQVSNCDTIKLLPSTISLCPSQTLIITGRKNRGCGSNIIWQYNSDGVSTAGQPTDSTLHLNFNGSWSGYIYGSVRGCSLITDSVFINVIAAPAILNLGADFDICPGNTKQLNAHTGYASYLWQDGSIDSTFLVTQPGTYFVTVTDACGGIFRDTVKAFPHSPVLVSAGPDRSKCNNDTLMLQTTAGFLSYSWSPDYNINSTNLQVAVINPAVDTVYFLKVELEPGCFGFDTIKVRVFNSPVIKLGIDTSLCKGATATLSAGSGFSNYLWNTGSIANQISVSQFGNYSVTATTLDGCKSYDTLRILQVYNNPIVLLNHDNSLCEGDKRVLDAGAYDSYLWQNGATTRTIEAASLGTYFVTAKDNNGCIGSDTTIINSIKLVPRDFLEESISKCNYEQITLKPLQNFLAYSWSTNSTAPFISISEPGLYYLDVTDQNKCIGRDSVIVYQRQCLKGLYVPKAFTPNSDGRNDRLNPKIFGVIRNFKFSIYNRYGQLVFTTQKLNDGWNGMFKGVNQEAGAFIWTCQYAIQGEPNHEEKGTFILMR